MPHAGSVPHRQPPVIGSHPSAVAESQAAHAPPCVPQVAGLGNRQLDPEQHPLGHERGPQTQADPTQLVPEPQAGFAPQRHSPISEQLSAREGSQVTHAAPPDPHADADPVVQVEPEQQPLAQLIAVQSPHAPPEQIRPAQS